MPSKHILVAEDEWPMRHTLSLILKRAGYIVTTAKDGNEALKIIAGSKNGTQKVDLLLTDIQMPGLTGLELITELDRLNIALPVLVITGYGDKQTANKFKSIRPVEFIDKPFNAEDLLELVSRVFQKREKRGLVPRED